MAASRRAFIMFLFFLICQGMSAAPYYDPVDCLKNERIQKSKDFFDPSQDMHRLSRKTLNHLITGLLGLLLNLSPESSFQRCPPPSYCGYYN